MEATRAMIRQSTSPKKLENKLVIAGGLYRSGRLAGGERALFPREARDPGSVCATFWVGLWAGLWEGFEPSGEGSVRCRSHGHSRRQGSSASSECGSDKRDFSTSLRASER